jgi:hypothetical protein
MPAASDLTDEQIVAALAVEATASGTAALLSRWQERSITADDVLRRVTASPRLQRVAAFCAEAQGRAPMVNAVELIRARGRPVLRWGRERRARK